MNTFEIDIPDRIYLRGKEYAKEKQITFSELCSLGVMKLMRCTDDELNEMIMEMQEAEYNERR